MICGPKDHDGSNQSTKASCHGQCVRHGKCNFMIHCMVSVGLATGKKVWYKHFWGVLTATLAGEGSGIEQCPQAHSDAGICLRLPLPSSEGNFKASPPGSSNSSCLLLSLRIFRRGQKQSHQYCWQLTLTLSWGLVWALKCRLWCFGCFYLFSAGLGA